MFFQRKSEKLDKIFAVFFMTGQYHIRIYPVKADFCNPFKHDVLILDKFSPILLKLSFCAFSVFQTVAVFMNQGTWIKL